jgi:hypothetical protein
MRRIVLALFKLSLIYYLCLQDINIGYSVNKSVLIRKLII